MKLFLQVVDSDENVLKNKLINWSSDSDEGLVQCIHECISDYPLNSIYTKLEAYDENDKLIGRTFPVQFPDPCTLKEALETACCSVDYADTIEPGAQIFLMNLGSNELVIKSQHFTKWDDSVLKSFNDISSSLEFAAERYEKYLFEVILRCPGGRIFCATVASQQLYSADGKSELNKIREALKLHLSSMTDLGIMKGDTIAFQLANGDELLIDENETFDNFITEIPPDDIPDDAPEDLIIEPDYFLPIKFVYRRNGQLRNSVYEELKASSKEELVHRAIELMKSENCF